MRLGEGCHMIGSPSGELLKEPPQQSGQGHVLALMPKEKREVCECACACVCVMEECTNREGRRNDYMFSSPGSLTTRKHKL